MSLFLGFLGGALAYKVLSWRRYRGHRRGPWRILRELGLSYAQKRELWSIWAELRGNVGDMRRAGFSSLPEVGNLLTDEEFNRQAAEELGARQSANFERLRGQVIAALERAHQLLTTEQRNILRQHLQQRGSTGFGPYRTAVQF
jgi:Spy/CpxP family protein refolding chaperone